MLIHMMWDATTYGGALRVHNAIGNSAAAARILSHTMHMRPSIIVNTVMATAIALLAACEQSTSPIIAGLGGAVATPPSSNAGSTAPLVISPGRAQLLVGGTIQLNTNAPLSLQNQVQWNSLRSTVATVSPSGLVTGIAVGTATITARYVFDTSRVATAVVDVTGATVTNPGTGGMTGGTGGGNP
jgi:hypothetical protein